MADTPASPQIDLLLVDDHAMFRQGLADALSIKPNLRIVGQCSSSAEALAMIKQVRPAVVLLDIDLGAERAIDLVVDARQQGYQGRVLVVTAGVSSQEAVQLVKGGVAGILHKHNSAEVLCNIIERVAAGEVYLEKNYLGALFQSVGSDKRQLTNREKSVLRLLVQGMTNAEIGANLQISESGAKSVLHELFKKMGVRSRAQLVGVALQEFQDEL